MQRRSRYRDTLLARHGVPNRELAEQPARTEGKADQKHGASGGGRPCDRSIARHGGRCLNRLRSHPEGELTR